MKQRGVLEAYVALAVLVGIGLLAFGVKYVVDTYNEALVAAEQAKERAADLEVEISRKDRLLARKQEMLDTSESIARDRGVDSRKKQEMLDERDRELARLKASQPTVAAFLLQPVPCELREHCAGAGGAGVSLRNPDNGARAETRPAAN